MRRRGEYQEYEHSIRGGDCHSHAPSEVSRRGPPLSHHGHYEYEDYTSAYAPSPSHHSVRAGGRGGEQHSSQHAQQHLLRGSQSMRNLQRKNSNLEPPRAFQQQSSPAHYPRHDPHALTHTNGSIYSLNRQERDSPYEVDPRHDPHALTHANGSIYSLSMSRQDGGGPYEVGRNSTYGSEKENYYYRDAPRSRTQPTRSKLLPGGTHGHGGSNLDACIPPPPPPVTYLDHTL